MVTRRKLERKSIPIDTRGSRKFDSYTAMVEDTKSEISLLRKESAKKAAKTRKKRAKNPSERYFTKEVSDKILSKNYADLSAKDLLGIYLYGYKRRFAVEDEYFVKNSRFVKEYSILKGRVKKWFNDDPFKMYRYIVNTLTWWEKRLNDEEYNFPSSFPSFSALFVSDFFYKNYALHCKEIGVILE